MKWIALRDDGHWALSGPYQHLLHRWPDFFTRLSSILEEATNARVVRVDTSEQQRLARDLIARSPRPVVVIDPLCENLGGLDWQLSRVFDWDMQNRAPRGFSSGPAPAVPAEFEVLDDDIASGSTMREVERQLGRPQQTHALLQLWAAQAGLDVANCIDALDARDFVPGARRAGLLLQLGPLQGRLPYMAPYVCLANRSVVPVALQRRVSQELWQQTAILLKGSGITIADGAPAFAQAAQRLGFASDLPLEAWCASRLDRA